MTADLLRGVIPVLEVPFTTDGSLDAEGFERLVTHVLATGVTAVMFPGFASEFHKLTDDERALLTRRLLDITTPGPTPPPSSRSPTTPPASPSTAPPPPSTPARTRSTCSHPTSSTRPPPRCTGTSPPS